LGFVESWETVRPTVFGCFSDPLREVRSHNGLGVRLVSIYKRPTDFAGACVRNIIFLFFFASGFSSLVFEVIWERSLMRVFGTTSFAISTLLTAFMAGLALGSLLGGRYAGRLKRPLVVYGLLEAGIGLYALLIPSLLAYLPSIYSWMFDGFLDDYWVFSFLRFMVVFVILVVPTTWMGATLPVVSHWTARLGDGFQRKVGLLYACNTIGACTGCLLAGFLLLPALGLQTTNHAFAALNIILGLTVCLFSGRLERAPSPDANAEEAQESWRTMLAGAAVAPVSKRVRAFALAAFAGTGLVSMAYQVLWTRAYVIVLGSSTYSFTIILTAFLMALGAGSAVVSLLLPRIRSPLWWLAITQLLQGAAAVTVFYLLDKLPEWLFSRLREEIGAPQEIFLYHFLLVGVIIFVPVFLQGMAFPLVVRTFVAERETAGDQVGVVYACNTFGAIAGSFSAGFLLMPALGLRVSIGLVIACNITVGIVFLLASAPTGRSLRVGWLLAFVAGTLLVTSPQIDAVKLTRGMFRVYWARELFDPKKLAKDKPELLYYADGLTATTTVERRAGLVTLKANGKPEASDGADMATQILVALAPFLIRSTQQPDAPLGGEEVAMVGFGSGVTAGAALQWPLRTMDVVEIEATMVGASRFFEHVNHKPLDDDRLNLIESDGRNYLEYVDKTYDVIISEPSNPWIAGVSSLFTVEHFSRAKDHLKPGGVFGQWVQLYELSPENVARIFATFQAVFPHVQAFGSMPKSTDLILVGSQEPIRFVPDGFRRAFENPAVAAELRRAGVVEAFDLYGLLFMNEADIQAFAVGAQTNTDDNGVLEFSAPLDLIRYDVGGKFFQKQYFATDDYGDLRPYLDEWPGGEVWSPNRVGRLAGSIWRASKEGLASQVLEDRGLDKIQTVPSPPFDALESIQLVRHARALDLDESMIHLWPFKSTPIYRTLVDTVGGDKQVQAMMYLEEDGLPPRGGFEGEKGLFYAYVLAKRRYYRHALEQLDGLEAKADPAVVDSLPFHLLSGYVRWKRRRYVQSFQAYLDAGIALLER
jgi:spermidine synthase